MTEIAVGVSVLSGPDLSVSVFVFSPGLILIHQPSGVVEWWSVSPVRIQRYAAAINLGQARPAVMPLILSRGPGEAG